ncbi:MAG: energy transducer TonB [Rhodanobacteraceae bacterium]
MPRLVSQPSLRYPIQALRRSVEGYVQVDFAIRPDGNTADVRIIRADPRGVIEREASRVVEGLRFAPPGRAIPTERQTSVLGRTATVV